MFQRSELIQAKMTSRFINQRSPVAEFNESDTDSLADQEEHFTSSYDGIAADDIPLLFDEVRQNYNVHSQECTESASDGTNNTEAETVFNEVVDKLNDTNKDRTKSCANCSEAKRVENVSELKKGQHISMPGKNGRFYNNFTHKLVHLYKHHAIIKDVKITSGTRVKMELIHFTKEKDDVKIVDEEKTYDLTNDEIYIIHYLRPRYEFDEIVRRAESQNECQHKFKSYNPGTRNCEHFATWCVVGEGESFQVQGLRQSIANGLKNLFGNGSRIAKAIMRLLYMTPDEIAAGLTKAVNVPEFTLGGSAALYLIYCIVMTTLHVRDYRNGQMCWSCLKRKLQDLWFTFGAFGVTSAISSVILLFALPLMAPSVGIPLVIIVILLSILLQWSVSKIRKALQNPFQVDKNDVKTLSDINIGDVFSLRYYGLEHVLIATEVHEENDPTKGGIRGIHYGLPHLFGTREVKDEYFSVDLKKDSIKLYDCSQLLCHSPENVVMRARKRIGETKWALASNRSDHFCFWAKVRQAPSGTCEEWDNGDLAKSESKTLSSLFIEDKEIHLANEMEVGDVIKYKRPGILIRNILNEDGRHCQIEMIVYDRLWNCRYKKYDVDLNKDRLYVKKYHPAHCHPMKVRAERANEMKDKKGKWWTDNGFIEHCILLNP